jgi:hypothetical protein
MSGGYNRGKVADAVRVVIVISQCELDTIDAWAIPAGETSRSAAIRRLLRAGLELVTQSETA